MLPSFLLDARRLSGCAFFRCVALALLLAGPRLASQAPFTDTLVRDINRGSVTQLNGSSPRLVAHRNGLWWLAATGGRTGRELWVTDGTPEGTRLTVDLDPGTASSDGNLSRPMLELPNGAMLFSATTRATGREPYVVPPSVDVPQLLVDLAPGSDSSNPSIYVEWQGEAWFAARTPARGSELWRSDGTAEGTVAGGDVVPGPGSFLIDAFSLRVIGDKLYFIANDNGPKLYVKPTPSAPAQRLLDLLSGPPYRLPGWFGSEVAGHMLFPHDPTASGQDPELWITDGTVLGTRQLADVNPGPAGMPRSVVLASDGNRVWFAAETAAFGFELWVSDGTPGGTRIVTDLRPGSGHGIAPVPMAALLPGGDLVFAAHDAVNGIELWRSDGSAVGTRMLADIAPGGDSSQPLNLFLRGSELWCSAWTRSGGRELWRVDTNTGVHTEMTDFSPDRFNSGLISGLADLGGGRLLFVGESPGFGSEPHVIGSSPYSAEVLLNINLDGNAGSDPSHFQRFHDVTFFRAFERSTGFELWKTDGTRAGTQLVRDLAQGPRSSFAAPLGAVRAGVVFSVERTSSSPHELWITDGSTSGTRRLALLPGLDAAMPVTTSVAAGDRIVFGAGNAGGSGTAIDLWVSDGTANGTGPVSGWGGLAALDLHVAANGRVFGVVERVAGNRELIVSDGTSAGTRVWSGAADPMEFAAVRDGVVFLARDPTEGAELFFAGGVPFGVQRVSSFGPAGIGADVRHATSLGGMAVFTARIGAASTSDFWRTDGTFAGTRRFALGLPVGLADSVREPTQVGDEVWFWADPNGTGGQTLWRTDGSTAGTRAVAQSPSAGLPFGATPLYPLGDGQHVAFAARHPFFAEEMWVSDGTASGTRVLTDSAPSFLSSNPAHVSRVGSRVVFAAADTLTGTELHGLDLVEAGGWAASRYGQGCGAELASDGRPVPGGALDLTVQTAPRAPVVLLAAATPQRLQLAADCDLLLQSPSTIAGLTAGGTGAATLRVQVPNVPALAGAALYVQGFALTPAGPLLGQISGTAGLEIVVGR